jgi:hypothetical protein
MSQLKKYCNKEIFIVYNEEDNHEDLPVELYITSEFMELVGYINKLTPSLDFGIKILHGMLTNASVLPKNLRGRTAFIIVENAYNLDHALISESDAQSDKDLADVINSLLLHNKSINLLNMENIYILYGYEISTILSLNEEELDEEIIDTCQKIICDVDTIKSLTNGAKNNEQKENYN